MLQLKQHLMKHNKSLIILFFSIIFITGLLCFNDYGIPWDEPQEHKILLSNLKDYSQHFGLLENNTKLQELFDGIKPISKSIELDHGEAIYYPVVPILYFLHNSQYSMFKVLHFYYFLIFFASLICLYCLTSKLTGRKLYGLITTLFLFLSPRMFAESFYNNKDVVLMSLVIICFWFTYQFIETKYFRYAIILGIVTAFTSNLRIIGFWMFGILGIFYILNLIYNKTFNLKNFLAGCLIIFSFFITFILITPACWSSITDYFEYVIYNSLNFTRWTGFVYYQGEIYNNQIKPLPWHYLPVMFGITTPLLIVLFTCISPFLLFYRIVRDKKINLFYTENQYYMMSFIFVLPIVLNTIFAKPTMYNGWRHCYFLYGPILIMVSLAIKTIMSIKKTWIKNISTGIISLQFLILIILIIQNHPNEYTYYNILAGPKAEKNYEIDYWNVSATQCLEQLIEKEDKDEQLFVSSKDWHSQGGLKQAYLYGLSPEYKDRIFISTNYKHETKLANYWIVNPTYQIIKAKLKDENINKDEPPFDFSKNYVEITSVKAFGNTLFTVYKLKNL